MKMVIALFFFMCLVTSSTSHTLNDTQNTLKEDLERQLNLNKPPKKSIHTTSGYIVDCVNINSQPAFDHPLLKNHKLQRKPSFEKQNGETNLKISPTKLIQKLEKVSCPKGTVPIQRITKDDLIRGKSLFNDHILPQNSIRSYYAEVFAIAPRGPYYGVSGITSVYNPKVTEGQTSGSHLYIENGKGDGNNKITVGWHVSPQLYKDGATHIYSTWTSQNFKNGCYNMLCPGFVQTNRAYFLGSRVANTSIYGGVMVDLPISLFQDQTTKNWWLAIANTPIGYFPAHLFSNLAEANTVGWGGLAVTHAGASSPPMGSGHFPDESYVHSCYFIHVSFKDKFRKDIGPPKFVTQTFLNAPGKCYGVEYYEFDGKEAGYALQFGGPGGNC